MYYYITNFICILIQFLYNRLPLCYYVLYFVHL